MQLIYRFMFTSNQLLLIVVLYNIFYKALAIAAIKPLSTIATLLLYALIVWMHFCYCCDEEKFHLHVLFFLP